MEKVKKTKIWVDSIILAFLAAILKDAADTHALLKLFGIDSSSTPKSYFICAVVLIIVYAIFFKGFELLYDKWLWKKFYPALDLNGVWKYTNTYFDGSAQTFGEIKIVQDPSKIQIIDGQSLSSNPYNSSTTYKSVNFEADGKTIYSYYEVTMYSNTVQNSYIKKKSVEIITIDQLSNSGKYKKRPDKLTSCFYNCVLKNDEKIEASKLGINNIEKVGTAVFSRK